MVLFFIFLSIALLYQHFHIFKKYFISSPDLPYGNKKSSKKIHIRTFFTTINYHNENEIKQNSIISCSIFYFRFLFFYFFI
jgi:hypothetical protein